MTAIETSDVVVAGDLIGFADPTHPEHLPNARLEVIEHAGHWVQIEQHDRFVSLVRDSLGADR